MQSVNVAQCMAMTSSLAYCILLLPHLAVRYAHSSLSSSHNMPHVTVSLFGQDDICFIPVVGCVVYLVGLVCFGYTCKRTVSAFGGEF